LKVGVCVKEVPDTASKIELIENGQKINESSLKFVINPYDEYALEEALLLKELGKASEVIVFTIGAEKVSESIRKALAMGADRALHLNDAAMVGADSLSIATALAKMAMQEEVQVILVGKQAVDDDCGQVGPMLAAKLGWPQAMNVSQVEWSDDSKKVIAKREIEGGAKEILEIRLPTVIGMTKGTNEPRYASLKGIMQARKKEIKTLKLVDLALEESSFGSKAVKIKNIAFSIPPEKESGKIIEGEAEHAVQELVQLLRNEAKVL